MEDSRFQDHSVQVKMSLKKLQKIYKFSKQELQDIRKQFNHHADSHGEMDFQRFTKFVGVLGFGQAQMICQRLFNVIVPQGEQKFNLIDFIKFLSSMIFGNTKEKARLSFKFLDKKGRKRIGENQISKILCQISILWNYLTGEKVYPTPQCTESLCEKLQILDGEQLNFEEYFQLFEEDIFDWYAFFNNQEMKTNSKKEKKGISLDNMESLLDLYSYELHDMILSMKQYSQPMLSFSNEDADFTDVSPIKGPLHIQSRFAPLRGDASEPSSQPLQFQKMFEQLKQKQQKDTSSSFLHKLSDRIRILADLGKNIKQQPKPESMRQSITDKISNALTIDKMRQRRATIMNKGRAAKTSKIGTIYLGHQNWNLIVNMMLGIRKSVKVLYMPKQMESKYTEKHIQLEYQGKFAYQLISKKDERFDKEYSYTFVDYAPKVFYRIRAGQGLTNEIYLRSIGPQNLIGSLVTGKLATLNQQISEGKSGNFFYYTEDSRFIAKTISQQQCHQIKNNLKNYRQYLVQNPDTYITKIYGLHKLRQTYGSKRYYFVVMENVFKYPVEINFRYDLKGSTYNRKGKNDEWSKNIALKDQDFIEEGRKLKIQQSSKQKIFNQIKRDVHFFSLNNIIQYSLLVGVHQVREMYQQYQQVQRSEQFKGIFSRDKKQIYFIGFIDYFTQYSTMKMFESSLKQLVAKGASCLPPLDYQKRFIQFLYSYVFAK